MPQEGASFRFMYVGNYGKDGFMSNTVICIGRQYGSGGREIGEKLAAERGITCYDKLLLTHAAEQSGLSLATVENGDEKPIGFSSMVTGSTFASGATFCTEFYSERQLVFDAQQKAILSAVARGDCVIIGRCASSVLRGNGVPNLSVFIYADEEDRIKRISLRNGIDEKSARQRMRKIDRMRKKYFDFYSDTPWGDFSSYDLMISSSRYGIDGCVEIIQNVLKDENSAESIIGSLNPENDDK